MSKSLVKVGVAALSVAAGAACVGAKKYNEKRISKRNL